MKLQRQKGNTCLLTSLAMCLDVTEAEIILRLGHDGQQRIFPDLVGNKSLRGIHPQELLDICRQYGKWLVYIEANPIMGQDEGHVVSVYGAAHDDRFRNRLRGYRGVMIIGTHAVAFDECGCVYDPNGKISTIDDCGINDTWLVVPESNHKPLIGNQII